VAWLGSVVLGVTLWQTGVLHLFFLAAPVWLVAALAYIALAAVAGARGSLPAEGVAASSVPSGAEARPAAGRPARPPGTRWFLSGAVALLALAGCLLLPFWVYSAPTTEYAFRLASFKGWVLMLTLVYFVAGVTWMNANEKRRPHA
jgi:NCS1 family nucleobase:cation symporter-1